MMFATPDTRLEMRVHLRRILVLLSASWVLLAAAPSLAGRFCTGLNKLPSNGLLAGFQQASARAMQGVLLEEVSAAGSWTFPICGAPNSVEPGYVPHGDPLANGTAVMEINSRKLTISIDLGDQRYDAHHAHLYSTTSGYINDDIGASTVCWAYDNDTSNDPSTAPYNEKALGVTNWPHLGGYAYTFYRGYLNDIDILGGGEWFVMVHMLGGHFAVDPEGHLIEWKASVHEVRGDADVAGNFDGMNNVRIQCNARHGRFLNDRNVRTGSPCLSLAALGGFTTVDDYFLDQSGVAWLDSGGNLTPDAIDHGYDLTTQYLFFSFADEGLAEQYGGPEGGAGGFINGYDGSRCDNWPPAGWGELHSHTVPEPSGPASGVTALAALAALRRSLRSRKIGSEPRSPGD